MPPHSSGPSFHSSSSHSSSFSHGPSSHSSSSHSSSFGHSSFSHSSSGHGSSFGHGPSFHGGYGSGPYGMGRPHRSRMMPPPPRPFYTVYPIFRPMPVYYVVGDQMRSREQNVRPRTNQPQGYDSTQPGYEEPSFYHCYKHDYIYYPIGWYDTQTGEFRGAGFYDENGVYYPNMVIRGSKKGYEAAAFCPVCKKMVQPSYDGKGKWLCPTCGGMIEDIAEDEEIRKSGGIGKTFIIALCVFFALFFTLVLIGEISTSDFFNDNDYAGSNYAQTETVQSNTEMYGDSYYVEALGRSCSWNSQYSSYYDPETDCYFWYNNKVNPPVWQYWYEGISSDYGDYGWMEYVKDEDCWYIEASKNNWVKLPEKYDTSKLWHM